MSGASSTCAAGGELAASSQRRVSVVSLGLVQDTNSGTVVSNLSSRGGDPLAHGQPDQATTTGTVASLVPDMSPRDLHDQGVPGSNIRGTPRAADDQAELRQAHLHLPAYIDWSANIVLSCPVSILPVYPVDVVRAINRVLPRQHLRSLGTLRAPHIFLVGLDSADSCQRLLQAGYVSIKGERARISPPTPGRLLATLHRLPPEVPDRYVVDALSAWGQVKTQLRLRYDDPELANLLSTRRQLQLELHTSVSVADLPASLRIAEFDVPLVVYGAPQRCHRCSQQGHLRRQCPIPTCRGCGRIQLPGHQCRRTYAHTLMDTSRRPSRPPLQTDLPSPPRSSPVGDLAPGGPHLVAPVKLPGEDLPASAEPRPVEHGTPPSKGLDTVATPTPPASLDATSSQDHVPQQIQSDARPSPLPKRRMLTRSQYRHQTTSVQPWDFSADHQLLSQGKGVSVESMIARLPPIPIDSNPFSALPDDSEDDVVGIADGVSEQPGT